MVKKLVLNPEKARLTLMVPISMLGLNQTVVSQTMTMVGLQEGLMKSMLLIVLFPRKKFKS